jgi:hypothetical protein
MRSSRIISAATLLATIISFITPYSVLAQSGAPVYSNLSPYWNASIQRWEPLILQYAQERNLDPDLVAAVIWKESLGRAWERSYAGAVGLMGIMPFEWRPSAEELENPWTNIAWGARALAHTIRDGKGDLYYALAAYNGGWDKTHLGITRAYATDVLNHYSRAVAMRYGVPEDANWVAVFATRGAPDPQTITVIGPQRPLARYTARPWIQADLPSVPTGVRPQATAVVFVDEYGTECEVDVWLTAADGSPLMLSAAHTPGPALQAGLDGSRDDTSTGSPPTPSPAAAPTQAASTGNLPTPTPSSAATLATPAPMLPVPVATATPTPTPLPPCAGGPLQINAWDLGRVRTPDGGWTATIFIQGHGGDCLYTYAWEGEIKAGPIPGPVTFDVHQTDLFAVIMGTASVTSAGETVEAGLFLRLPTGQD